MRRSSKRRRRRGHVAAAEVVAAQVDCDVVAGGKTISDMALTHSHHLNA